MRRLLGVLLLVPCLGMCGFYGLQQAASHSTTKERKAAGERFLASRDAGPVPEHFTYRELPDGGFLLWFAEPAFFVPTDFFYVADHTEARWKLVEAGDLSLLMGPAYE